MSKSEKRHHSVEYISQLLDARLVGDPSLVIYGIETIEDASEGHITFLANSKYKKLLNESNASAIIVKEGIDLDEVRQSIILNQGSVQHLDFLTQLEKDTFKTAFEIDQMWIVEHASVRQEWVCQGQSVNLFFPAGSDKNYVNAVHLSAWKKKLKGLYYLRTNAGVVADKVSEKIERKALKDYELDECLSCQG